MFQPIPVTGEMYITLFSWNLQTIWKKVDGYSGRCQMDKTRGHLAAEAIRSAFAISDTLENVLQNESHMKKYLTDKKKWG